MLSNSANKNTNKLKRPTSSITKSANSPKTAKVFMNGRSQAVRLPAQFRFDVDEVYIRQDEVTGDVILSKRANDWAEFFQTQQALTNEDKTVLDEISNELQAEREKAREHAKHIAQRDVFADWVE